MLTLRDYKYKGLILSKNNDRSKTVEHKINSEIINLGDFVNRIVHNRKQNYRGSPYIVWPPYLVLFGQGYSYRDDQQVFHDRLKNIDNGNTIP